MFYVSIYFYPSAGQVNPYRYYYGAGIGTRLTWATIILLVYNSASPVMAAPNFVYSNAWKTPYTTAISSI